MIVLARLTVCNIVLRIATEYFVWEDVVTCSSLSSLLSLELELNCKYKRRVNIGRARELPCNFVWA